MQALLRADGRAESRRRCGGHEPCSPRTDFGQYCSWNPREHLHTHTHTHTHTGTGTHTRAPSVRNCSWAVLKELAGNAKAAAGTLDLRSDLKDVEAHHP